MDWETYKRLCDRPSVMSRWMLEQTSELLSKAGRIGLVHALRESMLTGAPLAKPHGHTGGPATDMFELALDSRDVAAIAGLVAASAASGETTSGTRGRGLGGFREAWEEYLRFASPPR